MKQLSITLIALLAFVFLFLALPEKGLSSNLFGCCIEDNQCIACQTGECATTESFCADAGVEIQDGVCVNGPGGASCDFSSSREDEEGCCVLDINSCINDTEWRNCIGDSEPILGGDIWVPGASCGEVPQCVVRDIPTMSNWGLYALAAVIGVAGIALMVIRRRRSEA